MRATAFEFRHRAWIISGVFFAGFFAYTFDHVSVVQRALQWLGLQRAARLRLAHAIYLLAAVAAFASAYVRTWATAYMRADIVHDTSLHVHRVVADGPYRHVRNPLYLGTVLLAMTLGLLADTPGFCLIVGGITIFTLRLIGREEAALVISQGDTYRRYRQSVPRLLPSLRPRVPSGGLRPDWTSAVRGELPMWAFALAILSFAITFAMRFSLPLIAFAVAWLAVLTRRAAQQSRREPSNPNPEP